jgi:hypothetical protein
MTEDDGLLDFQPEDTARWDNRNLSSLLLWRKFIGFQPHLFRNFKGMPHSPSGFFPPFPQFGLQAEHGLGVNLGHAGLGDV